MQRNILLIDDTKSLADMYATALGQEGFSVTVGHSGADLFRFLDTDSFTPNVLIIDIRLPDIDGLEILARLQTMKYDGPVIIITGHGSIHTAVEAMRLGATDFLVKPFPLEKLSASVHRAAASIGLTSKAQTSAIEENLTDDTDYKSRPSRRRAGFGGFIGISPPMQIVYDIIENAAKSNATVFITGESGTGKEICAEAIHRYSKRVNEPFIAINCAAIPRELLESELFGHVKGAFTNAIADRDGAVALAHGGTLFLDEIAEMAPDMQTKLLRFLQNLVYRKVGSNKPEKANVRIICATNKDPLKEIESGALRQDLFYRLHVIPIHIPPLRERKNDIVDLADYFLRLYAKEEGKSFKGFSTEAEQLLVSASWPGNVRQLQNVIRNLAVLHNGSVATSSMLPATLTFTAQNFPALSSLAKIEQSDGTGITPLWKVEKRAIETAIAACEGNIPKAAAMLEISPSTIYRKKMIWERQPAVSPATL